MIFYLYLIGGLISAVWGWSIGQFFLSDLNLISILPYPEIILFPCLAISLAVGMVLNEIFVTNPTRLKLALKKTIKPLVLSLGLGAVLGLLGGTLAFIISTSIFEIPANLTRIFTWLLLGATVGLTEGLTWKFARYDQLQQRLRQSVIISTLAGLLVAITFELFSQQMAKSPLSGLEDLIGFAMLGSIIAVSLGLSFSPSYLSALRAGSGFEYTTQDYQDMQTDYPRINSPILRFVNQNRKKKIEEGLSIALPKVHRSRSIKIGSARDDDIYIPKIPPSIATIELHPRSTFLIPSEEYINNIYINGARVTSDQRILLKHNYLVSFTTLNKNGQKVYRFIF